MTKLESSPPTGTTAPPGGGRVVEMLGPLTIPDFRKLLIGVILLSIGMWTQLTTMGWVALELTGSSFKVSLVSVAWFLPFAFLALPAGALADRTSRKRILISSRGAAVLVAVAMSFLAFTDRMTYPWLVGLTFCIGVTIIIELPARLSFVALLVKPTQLVNAMALVSGQVSVAQVLGPLVAGYFLARSQAGFPFAIFATANLLFVFSVLTVRSSGRTDSPPKGNPFKEIAEGLRYVFHHRDARGMVLLPILTGAAGWVYLALMPVVAKDVLHGDAATLGLLSMAVGLGAIPGTIPLALSRNLKHQGRIYIGLLVTWGIGVMVYAYSPWLPLSFVTLMVVGMAFAATFVLATGIVLRVVEPAYHGRVMGTMNLNWGANIIGTLTAGSIAEALGVSAAVGLSGAFIVAATIGIVLTHPRILKL